MFVSFDLYDLFLIVPLASLMIYACINFYGIKPKDNSKKIQRIEKKLDKIIEIIEKNQVT